MAERKKVPRTRGLAQLEALLKGKKQKDLADDIGSPQSVVSEILNRWRLPTLEQAVALQRHGIATAAWTEEVAEDAA
jgi:antitoxin component HigA of HigAB toxin-antitoxin module